MELTRCSVIKKLRDPIEIITVRGLEDSKTLTYDPAKQQFTLSATLNGVASSCAVWASEVDIAISGFNEIELK